MKINFLIIIISVATLIGCSPTAPNYDSDYRLMNSLTIKEAVKTANDWRQSNPKVTSYVTPEQLIIKFPDGRELSKPLPADEFYVAIAPYINNTHSCAIHYISGCMAELANKSFYLKATDGDGQVIREGTVQSLNNGFIELWLPRDKNINLDISYEGLSVSQALSTSSDGKTCITTAKLQ